MSGRLVIENGRGDKNLAKVTSKGQLVVAPLEFSQATTVIADVINTAYPIYSPMSGMQFVITDILLYANKNVGAADASVVIYEADTPTTTTASKTILEIEMPTKTYRDIVGINLIVTEGKWISVKTNDDDIYCTILGYYAEI